jgi:hypothetical protein
MITYTNTKVDGVCVNAVFHFNRIVPKRRLLLCLLRTTVELMTRYKWKCFYTLRYNTVVVEKGLKAQDLYMNLWLELDNSLSAAQLVKAVWLSE